MARVILTAAGIVLTAGSAQAAFFSFASDTRDRAWTFVGGPVTGIPAGRVNDFRDPLPAPIILHIDDNNGVLSALDVSVRFDAQYDLTFVGSVPFGGGSFSHNYRAIGNYSFTDIASGVTLLTCGFENALFTARGSESAWYSTAALQVDNADGGIVNYTWGGANLPGYGLAPGPLQGAPRGFAFDLTVLNHNGTIPYNNADPGVSIDATTRLPTTRWWSESSYSANAYVPTPGTLALIGLSGFAALRRRRA